MASGGCLDVLYVFAENFSLDEVDDANGSVAAFFGNELTPKSGHFLQLWLKRRM